ncbi:MAG: 1-acyl-sn-glycerol-3-phosphate acyltransferase, partial [Burkholderiales bacterium]|nr:1-acyl-sn-glycerol-3-phosphate acyltransferase [Burkholderiales bacterium]
MLLRLLLRVRVEGDVRQLLRGTPLIVANHDSLLDGLLIGLFLPGTPTVVLTPEDRRSRWSCLIQAVVPCIVLDPARPLATKRLIRQIRGGQTVAIFPQGRISTIGGVMKVYDSAGIIAARCDADIVPVRITGTQFSRFSIMGGRVPRRWFPRVTLTIHTAVKLPPIPTMNARERRRRLADEMLKILQRMMFDSRPQLTLFEAFLGAVDLYGRGTRILEDAREQPESYGELLKASLALGRLCSRITREDEIVGVLMPNMSTTVSLLLGLSAMRRVPAMLNYSAGSDAMQGACVAAGIKIVI